MKRRLTLDLPPEIVNGIKLIAKQRNMTVSHFVESLFLKYIVEEESQTKLKKVV
ncbi:DUF6364 family protein [Mucilaginibacter sp. UYCu711]|uniref:DUF6364 family protein n=1 Tax=Mucilaginibacter sp. UYCu711 TaxID=3156339 RepID=UPI003D238762